MGPPGGAPKFEGTAPDQEMLITRLPAIRFCSNHDGFEHFFMPDLSSMVSGPLKKTSNCRLQNPRTHLRSFGFICKHLEPHRDHPAWRAFSHPMGAVEVCVVAWLAWGVVAGLLGVVWVGSGFWSCFGAH